jgi:hypothetical protein
MNCLTAFSIPSNWRIAPACSPLSPAAVQTDEDRRSELAARVLFLTGIKRALERCHAPGGDIRPRNSESSETRRLRGVNIQRCSVSACIEKYRGFTDSSREQPISTRSGDCDQKGVNFWSEAARFIYAEISVPIDFPPAPKLEIYGRLDPEKATEQNSAVRKFFSKRAHALTAMSHRITGQLMHNLRAERFFKPKM